MFPSADLSYTIISAWWGRETVGHVSGHTPRENITGWPRSGKEGRENILFPFPLSQSSNTGLEITTGELEVNQPGQLA